MTLHVTRNRLSALSMGLASIAALLSLTASSPLRGQGLTYVDAKDTYYANPNLFTTTGDPIDGRPSQLTTVLNPNGPGDADGVWNWNNYGVPDSLANATGYSTVYESNEEDSPEIVMRLGLEPGAGLNDGTSYDVYVVYWGDTFGNWGVRAGFDASDPENLNQLFDSDGALEGAIQGSFGASAAWTTPPLDNMTDGLDPQTDPPSLLYFASDDNEDPFNDSTPGGPDASDRLMRLGFIGSVNPSSGMIDVYIDDVPDEDGDGGRTFFDGLAFVESGNEVFATGAVNRDTGNLTVTNPTGVDFQVVGYSLNSPSGSLDGTQWLTEADDGAISGSPNGDWEIGSGTGVSELELSESDIAAGTGETFAQLGGMIDFGSVWRRGVYEDLTVSLMLDNGQALSITPEFTGDAIATGDFNADGTIDVEDYIALVNGLHVEHATDSLAYSLGDATGDGLVDRNDVVRFQTLFDAENGPGAFAEMAAGFAVPEPAAGLLSVLACSALALARRRRDPLGSNHERPPMRSENPFATRNAALAACALAGALASAPLSAAPVINWQLDPYVTGGTVDPVINDPETNSPSVGIDNGDGTYVEDQADQVGLWGATPEPVSLVNGRQVTLSGRVTIIGGSQAGNQSFRFGIFKDAYSQFTEEPRDEPVVGWLGYLAGNSGGGNDGLLSAKNPDASDFLTTATPLSTFSTATVLGADGRVFVLGEGGGTDDFINGTYDFAITIGRYGDEVTVNASMNLAPDPDASVVGDYNDDGSVNAADYPVWRDTLGTDYNLPNRDEANEGNVSAADYESWVGNYGAASASYNYNLLAVDRNDLLPVAEDEEGNPVEYNDHLTFEFDRVSILLSNHLNADFVQFEDVDISQGDVEALELSVDRATGAVTLVNNTDDSFELNYYEISSRSESLDESSWTSLAGTDAIDGVEWDQAAGSDSGILSEINLTGEPLSAPANTTGIHDFGEIYAGTSMEDEDLSFFFTQSDGTLVRGVVTYAGAYPGQALAAPEPASAGVLGMAAMALLMRRRRTT